MTETTPQEEIPTTVTFRPSSVWRRLAGMIYDWVAVVAIVMVVGMICQAATRGQLVQTGPHIVIAWWYRPLQYLVVVAYFVISWLRGGQTLGMRPWRMYLHTAQGKPVQWSAAIIRAVVVSLPVLLLSIGHVVDPHMAIWIVLATWAVFYAAALFNPRRRALHDFAAGTEVVHMMVPRRRRRRTRQTKPTRNA